MLSLITLRSELRLHTGQDELDLPDPDADLLLNRTYWEIQEKFHLRQTEASTTFPTVASQREYDLPPSFESLRISAIRDNETFKDNLLDRMSIKQYENTYIADTESEGKPKKYYRSNDTIVFWPTPDQVYTVVLHYLQQLDDLTDANLDPQLPRSWQEMLLQGAVYRGFYRNNDYKKGDSAKAAYIQLIQSAIPVESKEEWDSSRARVLPLGRDYP